MVELARGAMICCLEENDLTSPELIEFIEDALKFRCARAKNLFFDRESEPVIERHYDFPAFELVAQAESIDAFRLVGSRANRFTLDSRLNELIERYLGIYGDAPVTISRIRLKVFVRKLFRHAVLRDDVDIHTLSGNLSEYHVQLAGLRN